MSHQLDVDDLVIRTKEGSITEGEVRQVAELLSAGRGGDDTYNLLYVLGRSSARDYEPLVVRFLDYRQDPYVARLALQILCSFWGEAEKYRDELERFLRGVDWDQFHEIRQVAITTTGDYLRVRSDPALLESLLALAVPDNAEVVERRVSVEALAVALGEPVGEVINSDKGDLHWEEWASRVVVRAEQRLSTELNEQQS